MKSLAALAVAATAFAYLLVEPYVAARAAIGREKAVRARLPRLEPGRVEGYRLAWVRGDGLPALFVARPARTGPDGATWFATPDGEHLFAFDTVRHRTAADGPDLARLRRFLALSADERAARGLPAGWEMTVHSRP